MVETWNFWTLFGSEIEVGEGGEGASPLCASPSGYAPDIRQTKRRNCLCKTGLDFDFFMDLKEEVTLHKNCGWKLDREIADGNCGWSALGPLKHVCKYARI